MNLAAASLFTGCKKKQNKKNGTTVYSSIKSTHLSGMAELRNKKKKRTGNSLGKRNERNARQRRKDVLLKTAPNHFK